MPPSKITYQAQPDAPSSVVREDGIESGFIGKLQGLKYEYRPDITNRATLEKNFREKFEALNRVRLTDAEFARLLDEIVVADVFTASKNLRSINAFTRDDGTPLNYTLVNIKDWCKNTFEVINQLRINTDNSHHRYDVIILINGVPCVQIELKTLGVNPRRAMEQIVEYKNDAGNGYTKTLLCFLQLFIVSNRDRTYYFANNNARHFAFNAEERFLPIYEFADEDNTKITHLDPFAERFLKKCDLGRTISRYMVLLAGEQKLMIMRPYQVYQVKNIVQCIEDDSGNGFIWSTTGSGKTLTSFKASTLLKENDHIHKCVFVVDRKDLDRQTREEFNKFQEGCVEENTNTAALVRRLLSEDYADKVIVTTIQKLGLALDETSKRNKQRKKNDQPTYKELLAVLKDKRIIFIFDECHRSQFGENHKAIKEFFPKAQLFGFTGTPIFDANATLQKVTDEQASMRTTADLFQKQLHAYTITHAIEDGNVLRFHIDYFKPEGTHPPKPGEAIAKKAVIESILAKHNQSTADRRFNAILATASINDAIEYHALFALMQKEKAEADPDFQPLNIACVFSPPAEGDPDVKQIQEDLPQEQADNEEDSEGKKAALKAILTDYNTRYGTNHRLSEFDLYYQDVQKRIKDQQWPNADYPATQKIDITIVVDMLLTGFDSKFLNTLYVDKNLKHHGLIQAFSRTNRVLNGTKPYGNILDFRQQQDAVDTAIALFSGEKTGEQAREIWLVDKAPVVIEKLETAVQKLDSFMKSQGLDCTPSAVANLKGDAAKVAFCTHMKEVQRLATQLDQYTDLTEEDKASIAAVLPDEARRGFKGQYLETAKKLKDQQGKTSGKDDPTDDPVDQIDFEFVLFASAVIDYDYIMGLIAKFANQPTGKVKMSRDELVGLIRGHSNLMDQSDDIVEYVDSLKEVKGVTDTAIRDGYTRFKAEKNAKELAAITAFADTATYLYESLLAWGSKELGIHMALVCGGGDTRTTFGESAYDQILTNFSPRAKHRAKIPSMPQQGEIELLIATDCISEGQNLQDCDYLINYDIHWNPVRIIQRFGRIDRIGSVNSGVHLVNFWPTEDLNKYINLKNRVEARMALVDLSATFEDNVLKNEEIEDIISDDLRYRDKQLLRLKDEVLDIEDLGDSVSLTEFTLDDFRLELLKYIEANKEALEAAPFGLYTCVPPHPDYKVIGPGVIFCFRLEGQRGGDPDAKPAPSESINPLHPYFLVYVLDDGNVRFTFAHPKQILDIYRILCSGKAEAYGQLCNLFDQQTNHGSDMKVYDTLLQKAVDSLAATFRKRAASGLQSGRGFVLPDAKEQVHEKTDLELVTWLVIKEDKA